MNGAADLSIAIVLRIFLPFAGGYLLSYLFRSVNAVIAPDLSQALLLDARELGLLTSVYFLGFALTQIPLGILLDRFGPRRVEAVLLVVAAIGALVFAGSADLGQLIAGRALIGVGVSVCLMAAFKAFASWFAAERLPAINGSALAAGGVGAIAATAPLEAVLRLTDWRGVFVGLSVASLLAAAAVFFVVPDHPSRVLHGNLRAQLKQVAQVFSSGRFWRVASLAMLTQAIFMSVQSLWAGPWLRDVAGLSRTEAANHLLVLAIGMIAGYLILGNLGSRLTQHDIQLFTLAKSGMFIFMLVQLAIASGVTWASVPIFFLFGFFGTSGTLCYAILSQLFPAALAGRVNTALNLLVFVSSFLCQWAIGAVVNRWPVASGGYSIQGYRTAFGLFLALQLGTLLWLLFTEKRSAKQ